MTIIIAKVLLVATAALLAVMAFMAVYVRDTFMAGSCAVFALVYILTAAFL